jgi:alpha-glucosidase
VAAWWRGAVLYHVYVRSFFDSDGDGHGDLPGVMARLDYIQGLGVDGIWLSPIHPSPNRDWGYDVADYAGVQGDYGTLADFRRLLAAAHERGLKVLLDEVLAHTSDEHPWFVESLSGGEAGP